jgi:protein-S-isoprenylcysteine O-methyltransferase Ste14
VRKSAGVYVPALAIYIAFLAIGVGLDRLVPLPLPRGVISTAVGVALLGLGLLFIFWTLGLFLVARVSPASFMPTRSLIVVGPFRWSRNPLYLGGLLAYLGGALWGGWAWVLLCAVPLVIVVHGYAIAREERYLEQKFGDEYRTYAARVGRWI